MSLNAYGLLRPLLFTIEPETAHNLTLKAMKAGVFPSCTPVKNEALKIELWGLKFPNPIGLSAGFDKNAEVIAPAFKLGFGFVEAGTVTPKPQEGNPKPRVFRDPTHEAVINAMGFPNDGMTVFKANLEQFLSRRHKAQGAVGINIGMNKTQDQPAKDYCALIKMLGPMADYLTINISSPNTPGLRDLQKREPLLELLSAIKDERQKSCGDHPPPILVKLAPDLEDAQQEELAGALLEAEIDGIILGNTTLARPENLPANFAARTGGLSGKPLTQRSTAIISNFYKLTKGQTPIIGVGGISNGRDAYDKIKAGASLVQLYTGLIFQGPAIASTINRELVELLRADGLNNIAQAIGVSVKL